VHAIITIKKDGSTERLADEALSSAGYVLVKGSFTKDVGQADHLLLPL
jgi:hypothetical protein